MTCPQIGNYGVTAEDDESRGAAGRRASSFASIADRQQLARGGTLRDYLVGHSIVAISDVDTRALTRVLRSAGVMRGVIATGEVDPRELVEKARGLPPMEGSDLVRGVTCEAPFDWTPADAGRRVRDPASAAPARRRLRVAAYDFGMKWNILRRFTAYGCDVRVFPGDGAGVGSARHEPGRRLPQQRPGRSGGAEYAIHNARELVRPMCRSSASASATRFSALALGGETFKLKFGHRGANHPVKELETGKVEITSQNHGFAVDADSLPSDVTVTHVNLNDGPSRACATRPAGFSVQYHPEARPAARCRLPVPAVPRRWKRAKRLAVSSCPLHMPSVLT